MSTPETAGAAHPSLLRAPETFFKAQQRNRRATWRMSALCVFAALLMGIPLTLVLTPFLYAITLVAAEIVDHFSPLPPEFWQYAGDTAKLVFRVTDAVINQRGLVNLQELAVVAALVFLPGLFMALALWVGVMLLFRHGGVGGTLASLNAREPNAVDLNELQLADVVQEMAIAAGLPAPKIMLIDSPGANCAAVGTSPADAHIILSRRLLDDLDRDELQALVGHLLASVGNGDLKIAFTVVSVFETCGLIITLINAPFGRRSRSTLWRIVRYAFRHGTAAAQCADADEVAELLADTLDTSSSDIDRFFNARNAGLIRKFLRLVFFPFLLTNLAVEITLWFFLNVLLGPCIALLWRTRRYLADAGAVELTRNPDALAGALQHLSEDNTAIAGPTSASHLFVVNPSGDRSLRGFAPSAEQQRKMLQVWGGTGVAAAVSPQVLSMEADAADYARVRKEMMSTVMAAAMGDASALARMQSLARAMRQDAALGLHGMPDPADLLLAQRGDRVALTRIRMLRRQQEAAPGRTPSGLQTHSFVSFHPPLNKRAKRLQRMGAHLTAATRDRGLALKILFIVLYTIIIPLMVVAGVLMLFVIVMTIGLNLLFLALWLSVIHWAFAQDWGRNFQAFVQFVQNVAELVQKSR